jgi:NAD(P)-dependent dehydrogenase (short-subunit alcohol dehydrogenase family)
VINLLDQRVWNLTPHFTTYTLSKAGLWTLTRTLAMALAPRIRVNGIGPGPTLRNERQSEAHFREQWENVPLARPTSPDEVCAAIRFILDTPSMTGQMIALDGGEHMGWAQPGRGFVAVE